jgi:hypothetical protein
LGAVLLLLIPAAWLAALLIGMTMLRLAARSDRAYTEAVALWIAVYGQVPGEGRSPHPTALEGTVPDQSPLGGTALDAPDLIDRGYRAAG